MSTAYSINGVNLSGSRTRTRVISANDVLTSMGWTQYYGLAGIRQEIINQPGWAVGNSLSLIFEGRGGDWGRRFFAAYEADPALAPQLVIAWYLPEAYVHTLVDSLLGIRHDKMVASILIGTMPYWTALSSRMKVHSLRSTQRGLQERKQSVGRLPVSVMSDAMVGWLLHELIEQGVDAERSYIRGLLVVGRIG